MIKTTAPTPTTLDRSTLVHLPAGLGLERLTVAADYWDHADRRPALNDGRILAVWDYAVSRDLWERHPDGDELLVVLAGEIDVEIGDEPDEATAVRLAANDSVIVPTGAWHRLVVRAPGRLLFLTPVPACTEHRSV